MGCVSRNHGEYLVYLKRNLVWPLKVQVLRKCSNSKTGVREVVS